MNVSKYVDIAVDADTPKALEPELKREHDQKELPAILANHEKWLKSTHIAFFRNTSRSILVVEGSDSISPQISLDSQDQAGHVTVWTWKLLPGAKMSTFCSVLARDVKRPNIDVDGERADLRFMDISDYFPLSQDFDCIDMSSATVRNAAMDRSSFLGADLFGSQME